MLPPLPLVLALGLVLELGLVVWIQAEGWQPCQQSWLGSWLTTQRQGRHRFVALGELEDCGLCQVELVYPRLRLGWQVEQRSVLSRLAELQE